MTETDLKELMEEIKKKPEKTIKLGEETKKKVLLPEEKKSFIVKIPSIQHRKALVLLTKKLLEKNDKVLLVSLMRLTAPLKKELTESGVNLNRIIFIDAVSQKLSNDPLEAERTIFASSQDSFPEIRDLMDEKARNLNPRIILFDSLSIVNVFVKKEQSLVLLDDLIAKTKAYKCKSYFTVLEEDLNPEYETALSETVDELLPINKIIPESLLPRKPIKPIKPAKISLKKVQATEVKKELKKLKTLTKKYKPEAAKKETEKPKKIEPVKKKKPLKPKAKKIPEIKKAPAKKGLSEEERMKLQKKLSLLEKSHELGVISDKAYIEGKREVERKLSGK